MTRSYESNGPDVKIRGTAQHIAEKYLQLARDAQSSGDTIMAESLLQHAEHYFRVIAAAQSQTRDGYGRPFDAEPETEEEEDDFVSIPDRFAPLSERLPQPSYQQPPYPPQPYQPRPQPAGSQPQPQLHFGQQPQPYEERPAEPRLERQPRPDRSFRDRGRERGGDRMGEGGAERGAFSRDRDRRFNRGEPGRQEEPRAGDGAAGTGALPSFITAPVKNPNADVNGRDTPERSGSESGYHFSRRRRPLPQANEQTSAAENDDPPRSDQLPVSD